MNTVNLLNSPDPIPLSALQHYAFCPRQCALIHVAQVWAENIQTLQGSQQHERVHSGGSEAQGGVTTLRALPLVSRQYGFAGVADVVELLPNGSVRPVEYKSGKSKPRLADEIQLCAQAMCLEEAFQQPIPEGFIYHIASHKRRSVLFTPALRQAVLEARDGVRLLLDTGELPPPVADERCKLCSLIDECEPYLPRHFPKDFDPFDTRLNE